MSRIMASARRGVPVLLLDVVGDDGGAAQFYLNSTQARLVGTLLTDAAGRMDQGLGVETTTFEWPEEAQ